MKTKMRKNAVLDHLHVEMRLIAEGGKALLEHRPVTALGQEVLVRFRRLQEHAMMAQSVNRGLRTTDHQFNSHLAELLGEEKLN